MEYWLLRRLPPPGAIATYNGLLRYGGVRTDSGWTYGGYTGRHTVPERFVIKVPDGFPLESAARSSVPASLCSPPSPTTERTR